jgi:benzoyl-CoA reductase subunit B
MGRSWRRLLEINKGTPAVYDSMMEGTIFLGVVNALRGTSEGAKYFADLVEEMEYKLEQGISPHGEEPEKHRLIFVGVPCYPIFRRFYHLFSDWGGTFVGSTYLWFASGGFNLDFEYDLDRPLESLAEGLMLGVQSAVDSMLFQDRALIDAIDTYGADGVVYHPIKSCRTVSTGLADSRRVVLEERDVLCLYIESDMMDKRVVSEAQRAWTLARSASPETRRGRASSLQPPREPLLVQSTRRSRDKARRRRACHTHPEWTSAPRRLRRSSWTRQAASRDGP